MENKDPQMEWVGHLSRAVEAFMKDIRGVLPDETYDHLKNSKKELLLAFRSVLDREIEKAEKEGRKQAHRLDVQ